MRILVSGGAGFIGSHTCLELLRSGHEVCVFDNLCNGSVEALKRVQRLSNRTLQFSKADVRDTDALTKIFERYKPDAVIHFAGLKSVSESVSRPAYYYDVNVGGTAVLLDTMDRTGCGKIVFSSSATVYGQPQYLPCDENHPLDPINPYGRTKLIGEKLLEDWSSASKSRDAVALRYFNPVGADASGLIGENPIGLPNNLMPILAQVAVGRRESVLVFGNDYETVDGTGVRDYVHVVDLARAHVATVERIGGFKPFEAFNIGTGSGLSVLQMIHEFERQSGKKVTYELAPRRQGDAAAVWADVSKANKILKFRAKFSASKMCIDTWRWQSTNPIGY